MGRYNANWLISGYYTKIAIALDTKNPERHEQERHADIVADINVYLQQYGIPEITVHTPFEEVGQRLELLRPALEKESGPSHVTDFIPLPLDDPYMRQAEQSAKQAREAFHQLPEILLHVHQDPAAFEALKVALGQIDSGLRAAKGNVQVLNSNGEAEEIKAVLQKAKNAVNIQEARDDYATLCAGVTDATEAGALKHRINASLRNAGVDHAALDPEGNRPAEVMKQAIEDIMRPLYIAKAQRRFQDLVEGRVNNVTNTEFGIRGALNDAGVGLEVLDPEGKRSASEMETALKDAINAGHLRTAQNYFAQLLGGADPHQASTVSLIDTHLKQAEAGYDKLDPTGTRSAAEITQVLMKIAQNSGMPAARMTEIFGTGIFSAEQQSADNNRARGG